MPFVSLHIFIRPKTAYAEKELISLHYQSHWSIVIKMRLPLVSNIPKYTIDYYLLAVANGRFGVKCRLLFALRTGVSSMHLLLLLPHWTHRKENKKLHIASKIRARFYTECLESIRVLVVVVVVVVVIIIIFFSTAIVCCVTYLCK